MSGVARRRDIVQVDLAAPLAAVAGDAGADGLELIFWLGRLPVGRCQVPPDALPLSTAGLAVLASQAVAPAVGARLFDTGFEPRLPGLRDAPPAPGDAAPLLACERPLAALRAVPAVAPPPPGDADASVVVCTRDRPDALGRCLTSLHALRHRPREILVVDNAPTSDRTRALVAALPGVRYVCEPRPGLSVARNTGVRETTGAVVAFTDDDVIVDPDWLGRLVASFAAREVLAVTGQVLPGELETEAQRQAEARMWAFNDEFRRRVFDAHWFARVRIWGAPVWDIGAGANMAVRRDAFSRVGLFDERLGAGAAGCSEDSEFWYRLLADGGRCVYEPAAVVFHFHRLDHDGLRRQWHDYMRGHVAALRVQLARHRHWGDAGRLALQLPIFYAWWLREALRSRRRGEVRLWWAAVQGAVAGVAFDLRRPDGTGRSGSRGSAPLPPPAPARRSPGRDDPPGRLPTPG